MFCDFKRFPQRGHLAERRKKCALTYMTTFWSLKRIAIAVAGGTVLAIGLALVVLPGPAFIVVPAGLAILALEFAWAKRWLGKTREWVTKAKARLHFKIKNGT